MLILSNLRVVYKSILSGQERCGDLSTHPAVQIQRQHASKAVSDRMRDHPPKTTSEYMPAYQLSLLALCILIISFLYSSVGQAGASGYIAIMTLFDLAPEAIKPTALILNIFVAAIATWQFWRSGHCSWSEFWPYAALSVPMAFLGGYFNLPTRVFNVIVGIVLIFSAVRFVMHPKVDETPANPVRPVAIGVGGAVGFLAGLTGTGGGIFLTPILVGMHWASAKTAAALTATFVLVNSTSSLLGNVASTRHLPQSIPMLVAVAMVGGAVGSYCGSTYFTARFVKHLLAAVLLFSGLKLLLTP